MDDKKLKITKIYFSLVVFMLTVTIAGASFWVGGSNFLNEENIKTNIDYLGQKINQGVLNNLVVRAGFFTEKDTVLGGDIDEEINLNKKLPYQDELGKDNGWILGWGQSVIVKDFLTFGTGVKGTSGFIFLDGTQLWQDYIFTSKISGFSGDTFSLVARMSDDANYASCLFSGKYIKIEQTVNGKKQLLAEWRSELDFEKEKIEAGISVDGKTIDCYLNGERALTSFELSPELNAGGVGFKVWSPEIGVGKIVVDEIIVNSVDDITEVLIADTKIHILEIPSHTKRTQVI